MDSAFTRKEAEARWRLDLEDAEARSERAWPENLTAGMSEFERLTLITEILLPVRNELALEFEEGRQSARQPGGDSHGDGDSNTSQEDDIRVNRVYLVVLAAAAACNRWLKEDLGPTLKSGGQDFETPMTLDPATDIDRWARERTKPMTAEPVGGGDIERWLHWADLRTARTLPEETAPREEWSEAVGHNMALVREAVHRLTLARLHMRAGDPAMLQANVAAQATENLYRAVVWLASTLQGWSLQKHNF